MLESIQIRNFAIIDALQLEFDAGMSALTGETGAGKSIMLDAIKLVSGDRAESKEPVFSLSGNNSVMIAPRKPSPAPVVSTTSTSKPGKSMR